jgi:hypothetical protein
LGGANGLSVVSALVLQNLKTKKKLIREVCFGIASYTKRPVYHWNLIVPGILDETMTKPQELSKPNLSKKNLKIH